MPEQTLRQAKNAIAREFLALQEVYSIGTGVLELTNPPQPQGVVVMTSKMPVKKNRDRMTKAAAPHPVYFAVRK